MSIQDIQQKPKKKHRKLFITLISIGALFVLIIVLAAIDASNDNDTATSAQASSAGVPGVPAKPDAAHTAAYIAALKAVDPAIVSEKDETTLVSRGRDTCTTIYNFPKDKTKQADETNRRFTSPQHPDGYGTATAAKIVDAAHTNFCPSY